MSMDDPAVLALERSALLAWLAQAPARDLEDFLGLASQGQQVLEALLVSAGDLVRSGGTASLDAIHKVGESLTASAQRRPKAGDPDHG